MKSNWVQKMLLIILIIEISAVTGLYLYDNSTKRNPVTLALSTAKKEKPTISHLPRFSIIVGGTVVLSRGVAERIRHFNDPDYPWKKIANEFKKADLAIVNFKGPLVKNCTFQSKTMRFCGQPRYIQGMVNAGVDIVSLASNHMGDYGPNGILETIQILNANRIFHAGAGENSSKARQPIIYKVASSGHAGARSSSSSTIKISFLAYNSVPTNTQRATSASTGIAWLTKQNLKEDIASLRPLVDILMIMPNWGEEYTHEPSSFQIEMGHKMVDLGADLVLGDQAHWIQKVETYKGKYIFYGLGNLVFDQMWSQKTKEGLVVKFNFRGKHLQSVDYLPVIIEDYAQPHFANKKEKARILFDLISTKT